jgi:regulator of protease activity HflC (stomatin/prohibitin superfamily)
MFDRLFEFILHSLTAFQFWAVVNAYEEGVVLRLGVYHRKLEPGLHWVAPLFIERVIIDNVVPRVVNLGEQSLTTADGKTVVVSAVITARIHDIRKALLAVEAVDDALKDTCGGEIGRVISTSTWDQLHTGSLADTLTEACRKRGWQWGIEIKQVQLVDLTLARSIRVWTQ